MEPVLTLVALNHKRVNVLKIMRLLTVAVQVEVCVVIFVLLVFVVLLFNQLASSAHHLAIATVAFEVEFVVQLVEVVTFMTVDYATDTETVLINKDKGLQVYSAFWC